MKQAPALPAAEAGEPAVKLSRATFAWAPGEDPTLRDVSLEARAGQVLSTSYCASQGILTKTCSVCKLTAEIPLIAEKLFVKSIERLT